MLQPLRDGRLQLRDYFHQPSLDALRTGQGFNTPAKIGATVECNRNYGFGIESISEALYLARTYARLSMLSEPPVRSDLSFSRWSNSRLRGDDLGISSREDLTAAHDSPYVESGFWGLYCHCAMVSNIHTECMDSTGLEEEQGAKDVEDTRVLLNGSADALTDRGERWQV